MTPLCLHATHNVRYNVVYTAEGLQVHQKHGVQILTCYYSAGADGC